VKKCSKDRISLDCLWKPFVDLDEGVCFNFLQRAYQNTAYKMSRTTLRETAEALFLSS